MSDSNDQTQLVLVVDRYHCHPHDGAGQRTRMLFDAMTAVGLVTVVTYGDHSRGAIEDLLPGASGYVSVPGGAHPTPSGTRGNLPRTLRKLVWTKSKGINRAAATAVRRIVKDAPGRVIVVGRYLKGFIAFDPDGPGLERAVLVVDMDDRWDKLLGSQLMERYPDIRGTLLTSAVVPFVRFIAARRLRRASKAYVVSTEDAQGLGIDADIMVIPNAANSPAPSQRRPASQGTDIIFVGTANYGPNRRAVAWLTQEVWPMVKAACPNASLRIIGSGPWLKFSAGVAAASDVTWTENASDLAEHYQAARAVAAPVTEGAGTPIKVLEAAAWGRPTLVRRYAADRFDQRFREGQETKRIQKKNQT